MFRNNIFLGGAAGTFNGFSSGSGRVIDLQTLETANSSMNYNGYGSALGTFNGRIGAVSFTSLAQLRSLSSEINAQQLDFSVFQQSIAFPVPGSPLTSYPVQDLQLRASSPAIDTAQVLANINDDFQGNGPDLGAFEAPAASVILFRNGFE